MLGFTLFNPTGDPTGQADRRGQLRRAVRAGGQGFEWATRARELDEKERKGLGEWAELAGRDCSSEG
jgi:hypothetical protein